MGDRLVVMPRFHPQEALELVERESVTILVAVPTAFQAMLGLPDFGRYDTSSLLVCGTGAAPCPPVLAREIQRRFGCALHMGFGMTESAGAISISSLADSDAEQAETVGRPMPGIDVRIVDEERRDLPQGEVGELAVRGGGVMLGYYRAPELTSEVLDERGWLYTGDLATIDARGYLRIVGRKKDLIIRGGQNIYPAEIEGHLLSHPKVRDAAVVGVPSAVGGESVWAYIRLEEGAEMTPREVLDHCRGTLAICQIPSEVRFLRELPQAEPGKSQKHKLRAMALEEKGGIA
jgi:acyl-CoA synthetase (AMP-forming)/AMP-acid ligase II